jgi:hypothetical protein
MAGVFSWLRNCVADGSVLRRDIAKKTLDAFALF